MGGEPISTIVQNVGSSTVGRTVFTGEVKADTLTSENATIKNLTVRGQFDNPTFNIVVDKTAYITAGEGDGWTYLSGYLDVGSGQFGVYDDNSVACGTGTTFYCDTFNMGNGDVQSLRSAGNIIQTNGTTTLKATTVQGNIVQSSGTATLKATTADSLTSTGAATMNGTMLVKGVSTLQGEVLTNKFSSSGPVAITGNATVGGTFGVTGASTLGAVSATSSATTGNATVGGTLGVTGTSTLGNVSVGGTLGVTGSTTLKGTTCTTLAATGNATVGGTFGVTGDTTLSNLTVTGSFSGATDDVTQSTLFDFRYPITLGNGVTRIVYENFGGTNGNFSPVVVPNGQVGTPTPVFEFSGFTHGTSGNGTVAWRTTTGQLQMYLRNSSAFAVPAGNKYHGYVDFIKVGTNRWYIQGENWVRGDLGSGVSLYTNTCSGYIAFPANYPTCSLNMYCEGASGATALTGSVYMIK